ncbi:Possible O-succinylbenzoic acid--CoA ligase MenE [Mycobacteroides abscessus]|nr:Possible O-succinylbenzoic acid--CoA ligase MenE [Mycobacteroides abscessus]
MTRLLRALPVPSGPTVLGLLPRLAELLDGRGDAVLPVPADDADQAHFLASELSADEPIADDVAVVVSTSGTTGKPKGAMLTGQALTASGTATATRLGGPGQWLLALPPHHIAGMQVLLRSIQAGSDPVVLDVSTGFSLPDFVRAVAEMTGSRRYISLVATQLVKALSDAEASEALASFDAVLLGGGPLPATVAIKAAQARVPVVRTYGMSETCGGCVYDGVALDGVEGASALRDGSALAVPPWPPGIETYPSTRPSPNTAGSTPTISVSSMRAGCGWWDAWTRPSAPAGSPWSRR